MPLVLEYDPDRYVVDGLGSPVYGSYYQWKRDNDYYRNFHWWAAEHVVVGRKVWRGEWHGVGDFEIREGAITRVERVRFTSSGGHWYSDPNGDSLRWFARFPKLHTSDSYGQSTDGHEFSSTRESACQRLLEQMTAKLEDCVRDQIKWEQAINRLKETK